MYIYIYIYIHDGCQKRTCTSVKAPLVKCPSVQWQPDGLTIHTKKWFLGAGFLGAPPISLTLASVKQLEVCHRRCAMAGVSFSMLSLG